MDIKQKLNSTFEARRAAKEANRIRAKTLARLLSLLSDETGMKNQNQVAEIKVAGGIGRIWQSRQSRTGWSWAHPDGSQGGNELSFDAALAALEKYDAALAALEK